MHSKSYLHFTIFLGLLSISVDGFHVNNSDTHSISESIRFTDLPENTSDSLSESFIELIKQLTGIQVYLETKTRDMEKRDIELSWKEKEAEKREDGIKSVEQLLKQKEEYINKTGGELRNKEEHIASRETQVRTKEQSVDQAEKEIINKLKFIKEQEEQVKQKEENVNKESEVIKQRAETLNKTDFQVKLREAEVKQKEDIINKKETEVKNHEELLKTREKQLNEKENDLEKSNTDLRKQIDEVKQKEVNIEKSEAEIKKREEILQKREEKLKQKEKSICSISWVPASNGDVPANALVGGHDYSNTIYVGRANHNGALIPGKIHPRLHCSYISNNGLEYLYKEYEVAVLDNQNVCSISWVPATNGRFPKNAILGGYNDKGENLYVGRVGLMHNKFVLIPGKLLPENKSLCVPYDSHEYCYTEYQVAVSVLLE
ncbi:golgin subfamily A member 6-like protein 6 [Planococcus citri]|uniref:golgin subfamily A member 6-like protein 6 n=1 Tax=Planococcus citri TaxID=170843 RepID=UPI0031FA1C0D